MLPWSKFVDYNSGYIEASRRYWLLLVIFLFRTNIGVRGSGFQVVGLSREGFRPSLRGIYNWWGLCWERLRGVVIRADKIMLAETPGLLHSCLLCTSQTVFLPIFNFVFLIQLLWSLDTSSVSLNWRALCPSPDNFSTGRTETTTLTTGIRYFTCRIE